MIPIHMKVVRVNCNNYREISLFFTSYKILPNIFLLIMSLNANEIIGEYQCGFRRNKSIVDHI
jgi:hypothetical protein